MASEKILITGGTKGIGLSAARRFRDAGYQVAVAARNIDDFHEDGITAYAADLTKREDIDHLREKTGPIDVLINNAGIDRQRPWDDYPDEEVDRIVGLNLKAPIQLIRTYFPDGKGRVVNVASQAAEIGHRDIWYGITKAGLVNVTKSLSEVLGPKGLVINAVAPGPVDTGMIAGSEYADRFSALAERTILGRIATPDEIAEVIFWLGTSSPAYVNGEVIDINNGAQRIR